MTPAGHDYRQLRPQNLEKVTRSKKKKKNLEEKIFFLASVEKKFVKNLVKVTCRLPKWQKMGKNGVKIYQKIAQNGLLELFLLSSGFFFSSIAIFLWIIAVITLL